MVPVFGPGVVYDSPTEVMYEQLRFVRSSLALSQLKKSVGTIETEARAYFQRKWGDSGEVCSTFLFSTSFDLFGKRSSFLHSFPLSLASFPFVRLLFFPN
jgi:hypothetical protein